MFSRIFNAGLVLGAIFVVAAFWTSAMTTPSDDETLRGYADKMNFWIGSEGARKLIRQDPAYGQILSREFNLAISWLFQKFMEPEPGKFSFEIMDKDIQWARAHNLKLFGNALIYRADSMAPWLETRGSCPSKTSLQDGMKTWIQTMVRHGGETYAIWEVVNEDLNGHNGCFGKVLGNIDYIVTAYQDAREGNPNTKLLFNETFGPSGIDPGKEQEFFDNIKQLKARKTPIDIIGTEMHLQVPLLRPTYLQEFDGFLKKAAQLDMKVMITEMDIYQGPVTSAIPDPQQNLKTVYYNITRTCLKNSNCIGIVILGITDKLTFVRNRPGPLGHADAAPLLFDENYQKKPAYYGVLQALKEGR
jgi:endo-1,4-beta-xylanase